MARQRPKMHITGPSWTLGKAQPLNDGGERGGPWQDHRDSEVGRVQQEGDGEAEGGEGRTAGDAEKVDLGDWTPTGWGNREPGRTHGSCLGCWEESSEPNRPGASPVALTVSPVEGVLEES